MLGMPLPMLLPTASALSVPVSSTVMRPTGEPLKLQVPTAGVPRSAAAVTAFEDEAVAKGLSSKLASKMVTALSWLSGSVPTVMASTNQLSLPDDEGVCGLVFTDSLFCKGKLAKGYR